MIFHFNIKKIFTIKFYIEKAGTFIGSYDYNSLKNSLQSIKSKILKNPLKCPLCQSKNIKNDTCECGAKFYRSRSSRGNNNCISSFNCFPHFVDKIHKETNIPKNIISLYLSIGGSLPDVINGADYIYEGLNEFPIFVVSDNISIKNNIENKILWFYCLLTNDDQYKSNCIYDHNYSINEFYLKKNDDSEIIIKAPVKCGFEDADFDDRIYLLLPYDRNELFEIYKSQYNLDINDDDEFDLVSEFDEWFIENYCESDTEHFLHEWYFTFELTIPDDIDSFEEYKKLIDNSISNFIEKIRNNKQLAIESFDKFHNSQIIDNK